MDKLEFAKKYKGKDIKSFAEIEEFIEDSFNLYEHYGFLEEFKTPYEELKDKVGLKFEVVKRATTDDFDLECLPAWLVKFENGETAHCFPEEITKLEELCL